MALFDDILNDIRVELMDEFDKNFSSGGFFGKKWQDKADGTTSMLQDTRTMRGANHARVQGTDIVFTNAVPYGGIHNTGGKVTSTPTVTRKMQRFAWARYYKAGGKNGGEKAAKWRALALKPVGTKLSININMPQRQYIGDHPRVRECVQGIVNDNLSRHIKDMTDKLNKRNGQ